MPWIQKFWITRFLEDNEKNSDEGHKVFLSGVGMFLDVVKHLRPNTANTTWELSKVNDGANQTTVFLLCVLTFILDTQKSWLEIGAIQICTKTGEIVSFSDSYYAGNIINRRNVSSVTLYVLSAPVYCQSKIYKEWCC